MPIQFVCRSCNQPVEIDDEYAGQQVVCPFCEAVLTAPHESDFVPTHSRVARPAPAYGDMTPPPPGAEYGYTPPPLAPNGAGNIALALTLLAWGLIIVQAVIMISEMSPILSSANSTNQMTQAEIQKKMADFQKEFAESEKYAGKRTLFAVLGALTLFSGFVGLVLAIIALTKRNARKGTTIASLLLLAVLLLCQVFGVAANVMAAGG